MDQEEVTKGKENQRTDRGRGSRKGSGAKPKVVVDNSPSSSSSGKPLLSRRETQAYRSKTQHKKQTDVKASVSYILQLKGKRPIVGLTAYDAIMGRAVAESGVDFLLVGDSVGTTLLGYETTIPVTWMIWLDTLRRLGGVNQVAFWLQIFLLGKRAYPLTDYLSLAGG